MLTSGRQIRNLFAMTVRHTSVVLWVILFLQAPVLLATCPEGFIKHEKSCYFFAAHYTADWIEAGSFCKRFQGGDLVAIETQEENNFIYQRLHAIHEHRDFWVGGTDGLREGHWVWISTMQNLTYTDWGPGNPNDALHNEDCMEVISHQGDGMHWNDDDCSTKANFICEVPDRVVASTVVG